jgi:hypothetical protein
MKLTETLLHIIDKIKIKVMGLLQPGQEIKNFCFFPKSQHQWIKGDMDGTTDTVKNIDGGFVVYQSGRKCSLDIIQEYMHPVSDGPDPLIESNKERSRLTAGMQVEEVDPVKIAEADARDKLNSDAAHKKELEVQLNNLEPDSKKYTSKVDTANKPTSPIISLLKKAKTKKIPLTTKIDVKLPSKEFLAVLQDNWNDDILEIQAEFIVSQIEDPKQFLEDKIKSSLAIWFKDKP